MNYSDILNGLKAT